MTCVTFRSSSQAADDSSHITELAHNIPEYWLTHFLGLSKALLHNCHLKVGLILMKSRVLYACKSTEYTSQDVQTIQSL
jgi:hypothetical protein